MNGFKPGMGGEKWRFSSPDDRIHIYIWQEPINEYDIRENEHRKNKLTEDIIWHVMTGFDENLWKENKLTQQEHFMSMIEFENTPRHKYNTREEAFARADEIIKDCYLLVNNPDPDVRCSLCCKKHEGAEWG